MYDRGLTYIAYICNIKDIIVQKGRGVIWLTGKKFRGSGATGNAGVRRNGSFQ